MLGATGDLVALAQGLHFRLNRTCSRGNQRIE
jgi:hypothetical protein